MAKQKFVPTTYLRPKPRKRPGRHKKRLNKSRKKTAKKILDIYPINSYNIEITIRKE
jgi:hypothetical protein